MQNRKAYSEDWEDTIRPAILKRDNYRCVECNVKHRSYVFFDQSGKRIIVTRDECAEMKEQGYRAYRIYLQVAHLDNDKSNNDPGNLKTLCPICHHMRDKAWKSLMRLTDRSLRSTIE